MRGWRMRRFPPMRCPVCIDDAWNPGRAISNPRENATLWVIIFWILVLIHHCWPLLQLWRSHVIRWRGTLFGCFKLPLLRPTESEIRAWGWGCNLCCNEPPPGDSDADEGIGECYVLVLRTCPPQVNLSCWYVLCVCMLDSTSIIFQLPLLGHRL